MSASARRRASENRSFTTMEHPAVQQVTAHSRRRSSSMTRKALGRGLGALIPGAPGPEAAVATEVPTQVEGGERVAEIALDQIVPNPKQPRIEFDEDALAELAESIRAQGVLMPILVRPAGDGYQLIAGERRFRASQRVGLASIPAIVRAIGDDELLEVALIE